MKKNIIKIIQALIIPTVLFLGCSLKSEINEKPYRYVQTEELPITVRDFVSYSSNIAAHANVELEGVINHHGHPDFGNSSRNYTVEGLVLQELGKDKKPVYNESLRSSAVTSKETFDDWFNTKAGINREYQRTITFSLQNNSTDGYKWEFYNDCFFPIDGVRGLPDCNETNHNRCFTVETVFYLQCKNGESINIYTESDDDLWLFINGNLAIDLGGCHSPKHKEISFLPEDYEAQTGDYLEVRLFKAERCGDGSVMNLRVNQDIYVYRKSN